MDAIAGSELVRGKPRKLPYKPRPGPTQREARRGPYSRELGRLDRRFRLGRAAAAFEADLIAHLGGKPDVAQASMIRVAVMLFARLRLMEEKLLAGEDLDEMATRQALAWANSLRRTVAMLRGSNDTTPKLPTSALDGIVAGIRSRRR